MNYYFKNTKSELKTQVQTAVAVKFDDEKDSVPKIIAKGSGIFAAKILEIAEAENIVVKQDSDLARILMFLDENSVIPVETYAAIAKILSIIYKYDKEK